MTNRALCGVAMIAALAACDGSADDLRDQEVADLDTDNGDGDAGSDSSNNDAATDAPEDLGDDGSSDGGDGGDGDADSVSADTAADTDTVGDADATLDAGSGEDAIEDADTGDAIDDTAADAVDDTPDVPVCDNGYELIGTLCVDIDECDRGTHNCDPLAGCTDTGGAFDCGACPGGYDDTNADGTLCVDINECDLGADDCDPLAGCTDTDGAFDCGVCPAGYDDTNGDGTLCVDIDECDLGTDNCDPLAGCTDTDGAFDCGECPLGYADPSLDGSLCESLFATPPDSAPQCYVWGTAHMRSFDGLAYDMQGAGEWRMAFAAGDASFEVQIRQQPLAANSLASATTAATIAVGTDRVQLNAFEPAVLVNGTPTTIAAEGLALDGASLHLVAGTYVVAWPDRRQVRVTPDAGHLDVEVYASDAQASLMNGLCGNDDGVAVNDILLADGEALLPPIDVADLYGTFVHGWAVDAITSLFSYADGESHLTYFSAEFPSGYIEAGDLADEDRALYAPACEGADFGHPFLVEACILDAWWGDITDAIEGAYRVQDPELILPLDKPLPFARWTQQGVLSNGTWTVAPDYMSVLQSINGDPTFFVSPNSWQNVRIQGTITVQTTSDDDLVGFVFGYRAPVKEVGDPPRIFDTFLFDWKQLDQSSGGAFSAEGFSLAYLNGDFSAGYVPFWARVDDVLGWDNLATLYSPTSGWVDNTVNTFELLHTENRVDISMNGTLIFRQTGTFQAGRFGFYNYSQQSVRYADFRVQDVDAASLCGDGFVDVGEACDDGNPDNGDGCSATCVAE